MFSTHIRLTQFGSGFWYRIPGFGSGFYSFPTEIFGKYRKETLVLYYIDLQRFEVMDPIRGHVYNKPEEDNRVTDKPHDELST